MSPASSNLITSSLPNLIGGVSQQPWSVRLSTQCEEQLNCAASVTDFLHRRPATINITKILNDTQEISDAAIHIINRDEQEQYIIMITASGSIHAFTLQGKEISVRTSPQEQAYLACTNPSQDLRFLTINDYTFILNRKKKVHMLDVVTPQRPPEALVFIKQASYNTTYTIILEGRAFAFTTEDGVAPADQPADTLSSTEILSNLAAQIAATGLYALEFTNSTLWIRRHDRADFEIRVEDSRSNTHTSVCKNKVQTFSDLLNVAPAGYTVEITGNATSGFDNYYVEFKCNNDNAFFDKGLWKETVKPSITYKLDASTMPHTLVREADGSFRFSQANWGERKCGDTKNAPDPSFVNRHISGMFFYRNRLAFLAWDSVVMSKAGEFFDFFVSTVTTMLDNDPIDVAASSTRPTNLEHAASFSGGLLLFSSSTQFTLEHDTLLSNATVAIRPVTEFEADMLAAPVSSGRTIFFPTIRGKYSGMREYYTIPDDASQNDAADVTAHIPHYIEGRVIQQMCAANEDTLFVLSNASRRIIYVYKYFWNGTQKTQSCWSKWQMRGDVLALASINTKLFLIMKYPQDGIYIEQCNIEPGYKDELEEFEVCLDRKITEYHLLQPITYNAVTKTSHLVLPYIPSPDICIVTRTPYTSVPPGSEYVPGIQYDVLAVNGNVVTVRGFIHPDQTLFIGEPYSSSYTFSTLALRQQDQNGGANGSAILDGRLQLRRLTLNCSSTGYLEVDVLPQFRDKSTYIFTGRQLGQGTNKIGTNPLYTGAINIPLLSKNTQVQLRVHSYSFLPFALVNASWEGLYNTRNMRR